MSGLSPGGRVMLLLTGVTRNIISLEILEHLSGFLETLFEQNGLTDLIKSRVFNISSFPIKELIT